MRKCGTCGYLLFADVDSCKHCGAPIEELTAVRSAAPAAPGAGPPPTSPPRPLGPPATVPGLAPPSPASSLPGASSSALPSVSLPQFPPPPAVPASGRAWQPPPPVAPVRKKRSRARLVVPSIVLVLTTGVVGSVMRAASGSLPAGTSAFAKGDGVDYTSADSSYSTQFPQAPVTAQDPVQVGQFNAMLDSASVTTSNYEMATPSIALPAAPGPALSTQLLTDAMNSGITKSGGQVQHQEQITRGGLPALHATFKAPDGYTAEGLVMLDGRWLFVLFVHAKTGTPKLYSALDKSFTVTALP